MRRRFILRARAPATQASTLAGSPSTRTVSKKRSRATRTPSLPSPSAKRRGVGVDALGDGAEAARPVVDGEEAGHVGQQRLRRAHVARRLLAADVLLARLQRHAQRRLAVRVDAHPDDPSRHPAHQLVLAGEERRVRSAVAQRHPEALRAAHGDVRPELAGGDDERQRQEIARHGDQRPGRVRALDEALPVVETPVGGGVLQDDAEDLARAGGGLAGEVEGQGVPDQHLDALGDRARLDDVDRLRVALIGDQQRPPVAGSLERLHHVHRLGRGGGFVEQRRVGDVERGEIAHHGLEVEERLQPSLRDLRLIGRVLRVPGGVLHHVAQDHRRRDAVVVAHAEKAPPHLVLLRDGVRQREKIVLAAGRREVQRAAQADARGDGLVDEILQRLRTDGTQHGVGLRRVGADVSQRKLIGMVERNRHGEVISRLMPPSSDR